MRRMKKIASNDNFLCCVKPKPRSEPVTFQTGSRIDLGSRILIDRNWPYYSYGPQSGPLVPEAPHCGNEVASVISK